MVRRVFVLTRWLYNSLLGKGKIKKCYLCGKEFSIGEKVKSISHRGKRSNVVSKWVCVKCSKKYNIW